MTPYSAFSSILWKEFKTQFDAHTEQNFYLFAHQNLASFCINPNSDEKFKWEEKKNIRCCYIEMMAVFLWKFRKITHFFLAPGVADFCVSCVKELTEEYCKRLPTCEPVDASLLPDDALWMELTSGQLKRVKKETIPKAFLFPVPLSYFRKGPDNKIQSGFAIHFPTKEHKRTIMVIPEMIFPVSRGENSFARYYFVSYDGQYIAMANETMPAEVFETPFAMWTTKLIFGLSLYMDAFPETVVEAGSEHIHNIEHYAGSRHHVRRNGVVEEEHRHSISPHWRRGHFRLLTSGRFVHKSGQTIYVRGTFVKGKAFDVLDDAPPQIEGPTP